MPAVIDHVSPRQPSAGNPVHFVGAAAQQIPPTLLMMISLWSAHWSYGNALPIPALIAAMLAGGALLHLFASVRTLRSRLRQSPADDGPDPTLRSLHHLDERMLEQLKRAISMSETSALQMIEQVTGLRNLSTRLIEYLDSAQSHSLRMQNEIDRNGNAMTEFSTFVQKLPQQISRERDYLNHLVDEVRQLSGITETIRGMSRQTEILSINAAILSAHAGEAGKGFSVLAGEVRKLALQSSAAAQNIDRHIRGLVETVQSRSNGEFAEQLRHNEAEAERLLSMAGRVDEGYLDMRQFYGMLLTAVTEHNRELDHGITHLLDTAQFQDVFKQIVDRIQPVYAERQEILTELVQLLRSGLADTSSTHTRAADLADRYTHIESNHSDPESRQSPGSNGPGQRIELF